MIAAFSPNRAFRSLRGLTHLQSNRVLGMVNIVDKGIKKESNAMVR